MTYYTAGQNSDAVRPLKNLNGIRSIWAFVRRRSMASSVRHRPVMVLFLAAMTACFPLEQATAQAPGFSGFGAPNTADDGKIPSRDDRIPSRRDRAISRTANSPSKSNGSIRPISYEDEPEQTQVKTPFQVDDPIEKVMIEGNATIPDSEIAKHIKTRPGRLATQKQIKDDVDTLMRTRWFVSVEPKLRPSDEGLILVFRVIERPIVRRVEYKGLKKIKQKVFDAMTQLKPGSPFDISSNRECARRIEEYYHEKGFAFATVELEKGNDRDDREVVFLINEGPKVHVTAVKFDGNKQFVDGILKTKTRTKTRILWLFGGKYDPSTIKDDKEGVKQYYHSLGYFDVVIEEKMKFSDDKANLEIHYEIDEGQRYKIRNVEIAGNKVMSEEDLRDMMKVNGGIPYNARDINKDVEQIKTKYGEQGRLFCRVDAKPKWTEEEGIVDLEYKIEEDRVYRVRNINVHIMGDHPHTRTNLVRNISPVQPGDLADPKQIHLIKRRLEGSQNFESGGGESGVRIETKIVSNDWIDKSDYSAARGQSNPPSKPTVGKSLSAPKTSAPGLPSTATTQRQSHFGLSGWVGSEDSRDESRNPFVSVASHFEERVPAVTLPEEPLKIPFDEKLSPITPIFRAQSSDPIKPPADFGFDVSPQGDPFGRGIRNPDPDDLERVPPAFIDLDAYLTEARTGRLMFGVGVNSDAGLVGNIVLSEQNFDITRWPRGWEDISSGRAFRGGGQKFKIEAMPGTQVSRYMVDWQDPYFLDSNFNLGVSGFYFTRYYRNWYENRIGGRIRLGRQLTKNWSASAALRLEGVDVYNPTLPSPQILTDALGTHLLSTIRGSLIHDTRDAAFNTSEGHYVELSYEQAFGDFSYPRFEAEGRQYFTTYQRVDGQGKHTILVRGQVGWSGNDTPIFERFFAGGFQTFRGFAFRGVSPIDMNVYTGGNFMLLGGAEYQLPVTANEMIKVVGFTDVGTVTDRASLSDFRVSIGAGFRVSIPMMGPVPIAIDFAVPIMQDPNDIRQIVSFYVGMNR